MSFNYKILGQSKPAINTTDIIYTVTTGKQGVVSTIIICNQNLSAASTYSILVVPKDAEDTDKHYIYKEKYIPQRDTLDHKLGIGLAEGDMIKVFSSTGNVSFSVFGTEYTEPAV